MHHLQNMKVVWKTTEVVKALTKNKEKHATIVAEARQGYMGKAREALQTRLAKLEEGKLASLAFSLRLPVDNTEVYDTAIMMLEGHLEPTITLSSGEVRNLIMDKWDWSHGFLLANSVYSGTAAAEMGSDPDDFDPMV